VKRKLALAIGITLLLLAFPVAILRIVWEGSGVIKNRFDREMNRLI
jgi:hypothetical protein